MPSVVDTVAVSLSTAPNGLLIRTQQLMAALTLTAGVAALIGFEVSPRCPRYHWYASGAAPAAVTSSSTAPSVADFGCAVIRGGSGASCGPATLIVAVFTSCSAPRETVSVITRSPALVQAWEIPPCSAVLRSRAPSPKSHMTVSSVNCHPSV